jgi:hypothetical protein
MIFASGLGGPLRDERRLIGLNRHGRLWRLVEISTFQMGGSAPISAALPHLPSRVTHLATTSV